jgi:protocatechuate 3,4-dioxygenase alpha subunit
MTTTPSQTVGPFFRSGLDWPDGPYAVPAGSPGGFWIRGQILDGAGDPVPDALIETWQADLSLARPDGPSSRGFARCATDVFGCFAIFTVKPARVPAGEEPEAALQAPHLAVTVLARGLLNRVVTRIYFADEPDANAEDAILRSLSDPSRRATLVAAVAPDGYRFDIRLQGSDETVFFTF